MAFFGTWNTLFWNFWLSKSGSATCTGFFWKPGQVLWSMLEQHAKQSLSWASPCLGRFTVPCSKWMPVDLVFFEGCLVDIPGTWNNHLNILFQFDDSKSLLQKKMVFHHFHPFTPRKFNSSPLKKNGAWKTILSYWVPVTFQGKLAVKLQGGAPNWLEITISIHFGWLFHHFHPFQLVGNHHFHPFKLGCFSGSRLVSPRFLNTLLHETNLDSRPKKLRFRGFVSWRFGLLKIEFSFLNKWMIDSCRLYQPC